MYNKSKLHGKSIEREKFCVINLKYEEISWRVRKKKRKVTSRSTQELVLKNLPPNLFVVNL